MSVVEEVVASCAEGRHQWEALDGFRQPGVRREQCRACGARGMWVSAADLWSDPE